MSQRTSSSYRKQSNLSCFRLQSWSLISSHVRSKTRPHGSGVEAGDGLLRRKGDDTWRRDLMTSVNTKSTSVTYRLKLQSHITQEELVFYHSLRFFIVPKTTLITTLRLQIWYWCLSKIFWSHYTYHVQKRLRQERGIPSFDGRDYCLPIFMGLVKGQNTHIGYWSGVKMRHPRPFLL